MTSIPDQTPSLEHILGRAFFTAAQIILSSRILPQPSRLDPTSRTTSNKPTSHWFNLDFDELTEASPTLDSWKTDPSRPLVLEIFLQPLGIIPPSSSSSPSTETLLERWHISHSPSLPTVTGPSSPSLPLSRSSMARLNPAGVYKRLVILLRSLTSYSRILPAYKVYRSCKDSLDRSSSSSSLSAGYTLGYRVLSSDRNSYSSVVDKDSAVSAPQSPFSSTTHSFTFNPVDSATGKFHIHVQYSQSVPSREASSSATTGPTLVLPNYISTSPNTTNTAPLPVNQHASQEYTSYRNSPGSTAYRRNSWSNSFRLPTTTLRNDESGTITRPVMIPGSIPSPSQQSPLPLIITTNATTPSHHHRKTVQYMHPSPSGGGGGSTAPQSPNLPFAMTPSGGGGGGGSSSMMMMLMRSSSSLSSSSHNRSRENSMLVRNHHHRGDDGSSFSLSPSPSGDDASPSSRGGGGGGSLPRQVSSSTALAIRKRQQQQQQQQSMMMGYSISPMPDIMSLSRGGGGGESSSLPRTIMDGTSLRSYNNNGTGGTDSRRASGNVQLLTYHNNTNDNDGTTISSSGGGGGGGNVHHHYEKEPSSGNANQMDFLFDQHENRVAVAVGRDDVHNDDDDDDVAISSFMGIMQAAPRLRDDDGVGGGGRRTVVDGLRWLKEYVQ